MKVEKLEREALAEREVKEMVQEDISVLTKRIQELEILLTEERNKSI